VKDLLHIETKVISQMMNKTFYQV